MRNQVCTNLQGPVKKTFNKALDQDISAGQTPKDANETAGSAPSFLSIDSTLYRQRQKTLLPFPAEQSAIAKVIPYNAR